MKKYLTENKINKDNVIFAGNELNDKSVMEYIGIPVVLTDAVHKNSRLMKLFLNRVQRKML